MIFRSYAFGICVFFAGSYSSYAFASCNEVSKLSVGDRDEFYVSCTNSLLKPNFVVTKYYSANKIFGMVSLNVGSSGYFCYGDSEGSSCQHLPGGGIPYGTYKSRKSKVHINSLENLEKAFQIKSIIFRFPKLMTTAKSLGCFALIKDSRDVIIGLSEEGLYESSECLIMLERYMQSDRSMLFH